MLVPRLSDEAAGSTRALLPARRVNPPFQASVYSLEQILIFGRNCCPFGSDSGFRCHSRERNLKRSKRRGRMFHRKGVSSMMSEDQHGNASAVVGSATTVSFGKPGMEAPSFQTSHLSKRSFEEVLSARRSRSPDSEC